MIEQVKKSKLVGEFIKDRRKAMGLSQRALGQMFDPPVTTQFISNVERGVTPLPPVHIPTLAKILNINATEIMILLEKEYALKLSGRLGHDGSSLPHSEKSILPSLMVADTDYDFMKKLYDAYQSSDLKTRQAFAAVCEGILKLPKSISSQ